MKSKFVFAVSSSVVALAASAALAGTPLPDPPFTSGGFNPPSKDVLKQEAAVGNIISKYAGGRTKCDQKAVGALQKAYEAADAGKIADAGTKWTDCVAKANSKYTDGKNKQIAKGTPSCLDNAGIDAIKGSLDTNLGLLGAIVYCDGTLANPDPGTSLRVPATKDNAKGEVSVAQTGQKAGVAAGKCYGKAVQAVQKNGGVLPGDDLTKFNDCINKAATKGADSINKIVAKGILPGCLPALTAQGLVTSAVALGGSFTDDTYCASPSGAFVDGTAGF